MLVIRQAQLRALAEAQIARFRNDAESRAWARFPDQCAALGAAGVTRRVDLLMTRLAEYGIAAEADGLAYFDLMFLLSPDFDESLDWARDIVRHPRMPGARKVEMLWKRFEYERRQAAAAGAR